jgi:predicted TIM-barrel fold metal-dependent hydrolase
VHTHAFPDELAPRAIQALGGGLPAEQRPVLDGTVAALLASMDRAGIERSLVWSVATAPKQVEPILRWSLGIRSERIVPFASVHPDCADPAAEARRIAASGLPGIKLHPMYQGFAADERRLWPLYEAVEETGLILGFHAGGDVCFPLDDDRAAPGRILNVHRAFPAMAMVVAHLGGWMWWDQAAETLAGADVYLETSYTFCMAEQRPAVREVLARHAPERLLFGSDSPWRDQARALEEVRRAFADPELQQMVLWSNAARLLDGRVR